ncbi:unnamed protein product [Adineta ricciae]|uniref:Uncharacterized protein n=1 Tax=Adineta ricciae TaxID=249248 RepID=A0A815HL77_ADIRI|nr:unnamed protein product [Adineta ricciae]CAF1486292.1 unnamed protein product [Adineta ricciae]
MFKNIQINLPFNHQHTLDPKFILILFCVELGSLIFNSLHIFSPELHVYNAYNEVPIVYQASSKGYSCFSNINYCIYENKQLRFLKILDLIFISLIVISYCFLFVILIRHWQNMKIRSNIKITWYASLQLIIILILSLHILLRIILFERDTTNNNQCNRQNRLIRFENAFNYFVLSIVEISYLAFDLVNRQSLPKEDSNLEYQYSTQIPEVRHLNSDHEHRSHKIRN